jgi:hypothetical protein
MKKASFAFVLLSSPAFAQTPNLAPAPPVDRVGNPVLCLPIGKTSKGDLVYFVGLPRHPTFPRRQ